MSHMWMSHVTHLYMAHATHVNESFVTRLIHVTRLKSCVMWLMHDTEYNLVSMCDMIYITFVATQSLHFSYMLGRHSWQTQECLITHSCKCIQRHPFRILELKWEYHTKIYPHVLFLYVAHFRYAHVIDSPSKAQPNKLRADQCTSQECYILDVPLTPRPEAVESANETLMRVNCNLRLTLTPQQASLFWNARRALVPPPSHWFDSLSCHWQDL